MQSFIPALSPNTDASPAEHNSDSNHKVVAIYLPNPALISCSFQEGSLFGLFQLCREKPPDHSCLWQGFYGWKSSLKFTKQELGLPHGSVTTLTAASKETSSTQGDVTQEGSLCQREARAEPQNQRWACRRP